MKLALLSIFLFAQTASAMFEIRFGYSYHSFLASDFNTYLRTSPNDLDGLQDQFITGVDLNYVIDDYDLSFGIRYDQFAKSDSQSGTLASTAGTYSLSITRQLISLIVGYRLENEMTYFGLITGVGVSDSSTVSIGTTDYTATSGTPLFVGFELGANTGSSGFGVELGYLSGSYTSLTGSGTTLTDADGANVALEYSGPYLRFVFSLMF